MTPELSYFIKINVAIALFYAFYRLFFNQDTFFRWRRAALLCFFAASLLYPLLNIQGWIKAHEPMVAMADLYATVLLPEPATAPAPSASMTSQKMWMRLAHTIYWSGVLILAVRFFVQLGSIIRLRFQCPASRIQGVHVHLLKKKGGPFSFFHWIFIHPQSHTEAEIGEILTHEKTHVRQGHSVDVIVSELMCIFFWFNPFVRLMKREVRNNLEYLADHRVVEAGHDSKAYQYHLLGLAHHKAAANLSNNFNVLPLKNRIKMMNRQRTKGIGRTKYLMFLPLVATLMIISNIETVACNTERFTKMEPEKIMTEAPITTVPDTVVFTVVEKMPEFPGGSKAMMKYLAENIKYPTEAHKANIQGRVIVSFTVRKDGSITDIKVVRSIDPLLDKEAVRVISEMPKWKPGRQRGKEVNVKYTIPINFKLPEPAPQKTEAVKSTR